MIFRRSDLRGDRDMVAWKTIGYPGGRTRSGDRLRRQPRRALLRGVATGRTAKMQCAHPASETVSLPRAGEVGQAVEHRRGVG